MRHRFIIAYGPWKFFLQAAGFRAITLPWRSIYVLSAHWEDDGLRAHELVHIEQIERCGPIRFGLLYLVYLVRHGYRENPFEEEARGSRRVPEGRRPP